MTVSLSTNAISLSGTCGVEEVDTLVEYLATHPGPSVDISAATAIHTAVWQALMVFGPKIIGTPMSSFMAERLLFAVNAYLDKNLELSVELAQSAPPQ